MSLGDILLEGALQHGERTALWADGVRLSYRELVERAARLAGTLVAAQLAGPARRCAVLGARSIGAFTGVAAAALARSAWVPLNPRHPAERLAHVAHAAEVDALVIDEQSDALAGELLARLDRPLHVFLPDRSSPPDWARRLPQHVFLCRGDLAPPVLDGLGGGRPDDGAYLLFTSGSTGAPKGVLVRQANVMAYLASAFDRYRPTADDRFTQLFDLTFDLSVHDMFLCWKSGGALFCVPDRARMAPGEFVRRHDLSFWFSVPSVAMIMARLRMLQPDALPSLRWSLFCGEALPRRIAEVWAEAAPNSVVENLYGPTEATIAITAFRLPANPAAIARLPEIVPIGAPLPGQQARVIMADGAPAVTGMDGELYLGGSQVAEGYWRRPDLTVERFSPPADATEPPRWYRTGDRAMVSEEHGLIFLGRLDRQIKLGGHRVELQEVEVALRRAAATDSVAAIASPLDSLGLPKGITAFVTEDSLDSEAILAACRATLPPYMVPFRVYRVAEWPVNDNGKTDYAALRRMTE
ncbi:amino acid adenylation domain-containing protein [Teichococcus coralli]|nr:amino acid adenylation domain-containing protein [Pseudoroseomonas coralli]